MKKLFLYILLFLFARVSVAQLPVIRHNFSKSDSANSPLIDSFTKQYDFVFAYMEQASPYHNYKILAKRGNDWSGWTFSDHYLQVTAENQHKIDTMYTGTFWKIKKPIAEKDITPLLSLLKKNNFFTLNNDSLNYSITTSLSIEDGDTILRKDPGPTDMINYRFEVYTATACRLTESYGPDYFVERYKEKGQRKRFIECRDEFLKWWEVHGL